jgi:hypothetical protein
MKSMKRCFNVSKGRENLFYASWALKKASCCLSCLSDDLCRQIAPRTHNLPSGRQKKRLWWSEWSDVSRCRKVIRTYYLHHYIRNKRLRWSHLSDVLSSRVVLRTHNPTCGRLKKTLYWSQWSDVSTWRKAIRSKKANSMNSLVMF